MKALSMNVIPFRNMRAHPVRTVILLLLVLAQAACAYGGLTLMRNMRQALSLADARLGADILVYPGAAMSKISADSLLMQGTPVEVWKPRSTLERMADCDGIEAVSHQLYIRDDTGEAPVWIVGFDPETDFVIRPWIVGNREASLPDGAVWAGCKVNANADGCVKLFGQAWPTAARLDETGSGLDQAVFVNLSTLSDMIEASGAEKYAGIDPRTDYSATLIRIKSTADIDSVTHWLNTYVRKTKAVRSEATLTDTAAGIRGQIRMVAVITGAAWIVLLLALAIAQSMMMRERRKELFVWHAIGASRGIVNRVMLLEAVAIYTPGGLIGVLIAALWLGVNTTFMICVIALSIMIGCASTIYAVKKATQSMNSQMLLTV